MNSLVYGQNNKSQNGNNLLLNGNFSSPSNLVFNTTGPTITGWYFDKKVSDGTVTCVTDDIDANHDYLVMRKFSGVGNLELIQATSVDDYSLHSGCTFSIDYKLENTLSNGPGVASIVIGYGGVFYEKALPPSSVWTRASVQLPPTKLESPITVKATISSTGCTLALAYPCLVNTGNFSSLAWVRPLDAVDGGTEGLLQEVLVTDQISPVQRLDLEKVMLGTPTIASDAGPSTLNDIEVLLNSDNNTVALIVRGKPTNSGNILTETLTLDSSGNV